MFAYEDLREVPRWNNVSICLSQRIRSGLELVELEGVMGLCPDLLLWVLMLGRSGANPLEIGARAWFAAEIREVEEQFGVVVPLEVKEVSGLRYFEIAEGTMAKWMASEANIDSEAVVKDEGE